MMNLIECLRSFNRKERFHLIGEFLGDASHAPAPEFRAKLGKALELSLPADPWWAMDYHLDWITAALHLARDNARNKVYRNTERVIQANQEDVDLLLAYDDGDVSHLVLVEAKGVTGWTNKQMASKMKRLEQIFGPDGQAWTGVVPHLALMSPRRPVGLNEQAWPQWAAPGEKAAWIKLPIPAELSVPEKLNKVTRCDPQGHPDIAGQFWTIQSQLC